MSYFLIFETLLQDADLRFIGENFLLNLLEKAFFLIEPYLQVLDAVSAFEFFRVQVFVKGSRFGQ